MLNRVDSCTGQQLLCASLHKLEPGKPSPFGGDWHLALLQVLTRGMMS